MVEIHVDLLTQEQRSEVSERFEHATLGTVSLGGCFSIRFPEGESKLCVFPPPRMWCVPQLFIYDALLASVVHAQHQ
jgi:hypothetical protein